MPFFSIVYISLFTMFVYLYAGLSLSACTSSISIVCILVYIHYACLYLYTGLYL